MSLKQTALAYLKKNKIKKDILRLTAKYLFYKIWHLSIKKDK